MSILEIRRWSTPASSYPRQQIGSAAIGEHHWDAGSIYECYGSGPPKSKRTFKYVHADRKLTITDLRIDGKVFMVDDPTHWFTIQKHAQAYQGNVVVAGLGLGLIVHALRDNPNVDHITVVEINPDVISLVGPLVPECKIVQQDWYKFVPDDKVDGIFFDLFVGNGHAFFYDAIRVMQSLLIQFPEAIVRRILGFNNDVLIQHATLLNMVDRAKPFLKKVIDEQSITE